MSLTVSVVDFLMDALLDGTLSRTQACGLVRQYVEGSPKDSPGLALSGATWIHGFDLRVTNAGTSLMDHGLEPDDESQWEFSWDEVTRRIARWKAQVRAVREGERPAWRQWMRPRVERSAPEILTTWAKFHVPFLPDRRLATYVGFVDGYESGSGEKFGLDGLQEWLVESGQVSEPGKNWFDGLVMEDAGDSPDEQEAIDSFTQLLTRFVVEKHLE